MGTTLSGIPRVKAQRTHKAKPSEPTSKRPGLSKKVKNVDIDDPNDPLNAWRKK